MMKYDPETEGYTDDEKIIFDRWIVENDKLEMYVYFQIALPTKFVDLYHSFHERKRGDPPDKKGKGYYQKIIDNLILHGKKEFEQYIVLYQQGHNVEDEVSQAAFKLIEEES